MTAARFSSPLGEGWIGEDCGAICALRFGPPPDGIILSRTALTDAAGRWLLSYFSGAREPFPFPLLLEGTEFQRAVWNALLDIPYGETRPYAWLAARAGNPRACRAAGAACGKNPVWIAVPCHRAVGADGSLTGYAGGLERKRALLDLERRSASC